MIQVTQLKSQFANEEALHGADKQRDLVQKQKEEDEKERQRRSSKKAIKNELYRGKSSKLVLGKS